MSGCITFLQALWGCRYLFTLVLHVVRSCERPSDRSIPLVAAFLTGLLLTHERTLCVLLRKAKQRHFHGRPISGQKSVLYRAFPPSDTLWYVLFSLVQLCSVPTLLKTWNMAVSALNICEWVKRHRTEPQLKHCTGFAPVPRLFKESASGGRIDKQMSTSKQLCHACN